MARQSGGAEYSTADLSAAAVRESTLHRTPVFSGIETAIVLIVQNY
jgi:hypothetical protein